MTDDLIPIRRITAQEMCEIFNREQYWEKVQRGDLYAVLLEDRIPSFIAANEPPGTRSQMISYRDKNDNEVARVHQSEAGWNDRSKPQTRSQAFVIQWRSLSLAQEAQRITALSRLFHSY